MLQWPGGSASGHQVDNAAAIADHTVDRGADLGVAEIDPGEVALSGCLLEQGLGCSLLRVDHVDLPLGNVGF
jgi:hypothetical protein